MNGELRHEQCRYGRLTEAWHYAPVGGETPTVIPLCGWQIPEPAPPAAVRVWGGAVDYQRDCAKCAAFRPVEAPSEAPATFPLPEGFRAFTGGGRPVGPKAMIRVTLRDGFVIGPRRAESWPWNEPTDVPWDIVGWQEVAED